MSDLLSSLPSQKPAEAPVSLSATTAPPDGAKASIPTRKGPPPVWRATYMTGHVLTFYAADEKAARDHADYFGGRYGIGAAGPVVPDAGAPVGISPWIGAVDAYVPPKPVAAAPAPVVSSMPVEG